MNVSNSTFSSNTATVDGGAIYVNGGKFNSSNTKYHSNSAADDGGAIFLRGGVSGTNHTFSGDFFTSNSGPYGGAIRAEHPMTVDYSTFVGNSASVTGMAVNISGSAGNIIRNSTVSGNTSSTPTGAIHVYASSATGTLLTLQHVTIADNWDLSTSLEIPLFRETHTSSSGGTVVIRNSILIGECSVDQVNRITITASGSRSTNGDCVNESTLTSVIAQSDLAAFTAVSGKTGGYYELITGGAAIAAGRQRPTA